MTATEPEPAEPAPRVKVGFFRNPWIHGDQIDPECGHTWNRHGYIDLTDHGYTVCPADAPVPWHPSNSLGVDLVAVLQAHGLDEDALVVEIYATTEQVAVKIIDDNNSNVFPPRHRMVAMDPRRS